MAASCFPAPFKLFTEKHERTTDVANSIEELKRDLDGITEALKQNGDRHGAVRDKFEAVESEIFKRLKGIIVAGQKEDREKLAAIEIESQKMKEENRLANQQTDKKFDLLFDTLKASRECDIKTAANNFLLLKSEITVRGKAKASSVIRLVHRKYRTKDNLKENRKNATKSKNLLGRMKKLRREMEDIMEDQKHIRERQKGVRSRFEALKSDMEESSEEQRRIKEGQKGIRDKIAAIEAECETLKEETRFIMQQIDNRFDLFNQYLKATRDGDTETATNVFLRLQRQIIAKRGKANSSP